jgi:hypothetical protein
MKLVLSLGRFLSVSVAMVVSCAGCGGLGSNGAPSFKIVTVSVPNGSVGVNYYAALETWTGVEPYRWTMSVGALPPGLTFNVFSHDSFRAVITGIPTASGSFPFTAVVTDARGNRAQRSFTLVIGQQRATPRWRITASIPRVRSAWSIPTVYDVALKISTSEHFLPFGTAEEFWVSGIQSGTEYVEIDLGFDYVVYETFRIKIEAVIDPDTSINSGTATTLWLFQGLPSELETPIEREWTVNVGFNGQGPNRTQIVHRFSAVRIP